MWFFSDQSEAAVPVLVQCVSTRGHSWRQAHIWTERAMRPHPSHTHTHILFQWFSRRTDDYLTSVKWMGGSCDSKTNSGWFKGTLPYFSVLCSSLTGQRTNLANFTSQPTGWHQYLSHPVTDTHIYEWSSCSEERLHVISCFTQTIFSPVYPQPGISGVFGHFVTHKVKSHCSSLTSDVTAESCSCTSLDHL